MRCRLSPHRADRQTDNYVSGCCNRTENRTKCPRAVEECLWLMGDFLREMTFAEPLREGLDKICQDGRTGVEARGKRH